MLMKYNILLIGPQEQIQKSTKIRFHGLAFYLKSDHCIHQRVKTSNHIVNCNAEVNLYKPTFQNLCPERSRSLLFLKAVFFWWIKAWFSQMSKMAIILNIREENKSLVKGFFLFTQKTLVQDFGAIQLKPNMNSKRSLTLQLQVFNYYLIQINVKLIYKLSYHEITKKILLIKMLIFH